ncbi:putative FBD-associated F-box protein At5g56410 isoform X2 [Cornus florida]|uniref:putative FBD-associated F-box protein At5g56410 isoform X2 n=1 Tax=Cornus florida TaxID=4283 RepID=UPI002899229B|nr:putative FBD-associated F-box protein At5g56410 isoform X2 [Cornus florida]
MDSISKRQNFSQKVKIKESGVDRISNLPSSVMGHILSFLPTKYAVATSVLSTKWKYLWTSLTTLDHDDELLLVSFGPRNSTKQKIQEMSFIKFVYRVFMLNVSDLRDLHLKCSRIDDVSHLNAWISAAVARNVREIYISLPVKEYNATRDLFTCKSLVVFTLCGKFVLNVPTSVCLQNLKILRLVLVTFSDDSINRLFPSCPMLQHFSMIACVWVNVGVFNIFAPSLKSLSIRGISCHDNTFSWKHKIVLNAPNLQLLDYNDYVTEGYSMNNLNALVQAKIVLFGTSVRDNSVKELVEGISKVQRLHLSCFSMEV